MSVCSSKLGFCNWYDFGLAETKGIQSWFTGENLIPAFREFDAKLFASQFSRVPSCVKTVTLRQEMRSKSKHAWEQKRPKTRGG